MLLCHVTCYFVFRLILRDDDDDDELMMNCFCGTVDRRKVFNLISSRDHFQRSHHCESLTHRKKRLDLRRT